MFSTISENPFKAAGKLANEATKKMIKTNYELGRPEWQPKWESNTTMQFGQVTVKFLI